MTGNLDQNSLKSVEVSEWLMAMNGSGRMALGKDTHASTKKYTLSISLEKPCV